MDNNIINLLKPFIKEIKVSLPKLSYQKLIDIIVSTYYEVILEESSKGNIITLPCSIGNVLVTVEDKYKVNENNDKAIFEIKYFPNKEFYKMTRRAKWDIVLTKPYKETLAVEIKKDYKRFISNKTFFDRYRKKDNTNIINKYIYDYNV